MKAAAIKRLVVDASVSLAWCFEDEGTHWTERILDMLSAGTQALAPAIWPLEIANALLMAERRKRITTAQVTALLQRIARLPIIIEPVLSDRIFNSVFSTARQQQLTVYDAAYVELALREAVPLATLDVKLRAAAQAAGILLLE